MYWIYLILFILAILSPQMIGWHFAFFREDDLESLTVFFFGLVAFLLYMAKEKALLRAIQERLKLQKRANIITRDLSDSYSYIGEMNRKLDIVQEVIFNLPHNSAEAFKKHGKRAYMPLLEAARLLSKADTCSLRFVDTKKKTIIRVVEDEHACFSHFDGHALIAKKKSFWEEGDCIVARSPRPACDAYAFLIFPKTANHFEDIEIFQIIASQALFLFCAEQGLLCEHVPAVSKKKPAKEG